MRAEGTPGDSDRLPRINVVARREGGAAGSVRAFQRPYRRRASGPGLDASIRGRRGPRRPRLWPRHLRHEGRARGGDRGGRDAAGERPAPAGGDRDLGHGRRGIGRLWRRRLPGAARALLAAAGRPRDHPGAAQRRPGLHRPSRRVVGRDRDPGADRARLDAVPGRLRRAAHGGGDRGFERELWPALAARAHGDAGGAADGARRLDAQPQLGPWRAGRRGHAGLPSPVRARPLPAGDRPALPDRGGHRRR